jgi:hypothetical protein
LRMLVVLSCVVSSGCASFAFAVRDAGANNNEVPIDRSTPHTDTRWSKLWGGMGDLWDPRTCTDPGPDARADQCKAASDPCHGKGVGYFEVKLPWYSYFVRAVTFGAVTAADVTVYCRTDSPPGPGPSPVPEGP